MVTLLFAAMMIDVVPLLLTLYVTVTGNAIGFAIVTTGFGASF
jgi:hypothetical protein